MLQFLGFYIGARDHNSGPHTCQARALFTGIPVQLFYMVIDSVGINLHSHQKGVGSLFSTSSPVFIIIHLCDNHHFNLCEVITDGTYFYFLVILFYFVSYV